MTKIIASKFLKNRATQEGLKGNNRKEIEESLEGAVKEMNDNFHNKTKGKGEREGIYYVRISNRYFNKKTEIVKLKEGDKLTGAFQKRIEGETPRKDVRAEKAKEGMLLLHVEAVIYAKNVLAEGKENSDLSADFEIVTFLGCVEDKPTPRSVETLLANHFKDSGGTATGYDPQMLEEKLKESYFFWKDKAVKDKDNN